MYIRGRKKGFTLIELLVVISIISLLSSVVLSSLNSARVKARDAQRKTTLHQLANANELFRGDIGYYAGTAGWFGNPGHGGLDAAFVPAYISVVQDDPKSAGSYMYWRKDYVGYTCLLGGEPERYGFYAALENPSSADTATISDAFDRCVRDTWGMNYKVGN
jgi:prepilin-type N-terminal cleavage/methylation domain-containing protein